MTVKNDIWWTYYCSDSMVLDEENVGKWMYFFDVFQEDYKAETLCRNAIEKGIVNICKHTNLTTLEVNPNIKNHQGVCCFYIDGKNKEQHKKVIRFFIENDMIQRTSSGRFYNISFKYDKQTHSGEYGSNYHGSIRLNQFVDLNTGEWLEDRPQQKTVDQTGSKNCGYSKDIIAIIDVETNYYNEAMSVGVALGTSDSFELIDTRYYIFEDEVECGGMYSYALLKKDMFPIYVKRTSFDWRKDIEDWFKQNGVSRIFAYNARFDYSHLMELEHYKWYDIMKIAANIEYNKAIPADAELYKSGRMKRGYGVENIYRYLSCNNDYHETHNALLDAIDELKIMQMLGVAIEQYEPSRINPIDPKLKNKYRVGDQVETKEDGVGTILSIEELTHILMLEVSFSSGTKRIPGLLDSPTVVPKKHLEKMRNPEGPVLIDEKAQPKNSKEIKRMIDINSGGRIHASNYKMMTGHISLTCIICGYSWSCKYYEVTTCPRCKSKWPGDV